MDVSRSHEVARWFSNIAQVATLHSHIWYSARRRVVQCVDGIFPRKEQEYLGHTILHAALCPRLPTPLPLDHHVNESSWVISTHVAVSFALDSVTTKLHCRENDVHIDNKDIVDQWKARPTEKIRNS